MATYTELQERVQHIVIDLPTSVTAQVPTLVKEAIRKLQTKHSFKVCEALIGPSVTVVGTRTLVAIPSNFIKWRKKPYRIEQNGKVTDLEWAVDRQSVEREYGTAAGGEAVTADLSGNPRVLLVGEPSDELGTQNIEVYPLPDGDSLYSDGEYRIAIPYYKFLTTLSAGSSQNWFTNNAEEWICWSAAAEAFFLNWDEERGTMWMQKAAGQFQDVVLRDKHLRLSQVTELVPQPDARGSRVMGRDRGLR